MPAGDYVVHVANAQACLEIDDRVLRDVVSRALEAEQVVRAEISLAIVDDAAIHELNRRHLNHDEPTDVLSFLLETDVVGPASRTPAEDLVSRASGRRGPAKPAAKREPRGAGKALEGEVVVSAETAVRRAAEFAWSPQHELALYLVHGVLHLAGYDDRTPGERRLMRRREREILALWGLVPAYRRRWRQPG